MKIRTLLALSAHLGFAAAAVAATGDCYKHADDISVGTSKKVTLVQELNMDYDPDIDDSQYLDNGCYYLTFNVKWGQAYTIYTTGASEANEIDFDVLDVSEWDWEAEVSWPGFSVDSSYDGYNYRGIMASDDWWDDDDASVTCYAYVSGAVGQTVTVTLKSGVEEEEAPPGSPDNPKAITFTTTEQKHSDKLYGTSYLLTAKLTKDKKYKIGTTGGTAANPLTVTAVASNGEQPDCTVFADWTNEYNEAWLVVANWTGTHYFTVSGADGAGFGFRYQMVGARKPEDHAGILELATPTAAGSTSVELDAPGRRNAVNSGYYDQIIDEKLVHVSLKAGKYYRFSVEGADTNLCLEVYAKGGEEAIAKTSGCDDPVLAYLPAKDGDYYVGVCQDLEDDEADTPTCCACTLRAECYAKGEGLTDEWDPGDDTFADASGLTPAVGTLTDDVVEKGAVHGPHVLGATDWVDTFAIAARKGLVYRLRSQLAEESAGEGWKLGGKIYTISSKGVRTDVKSFDDLADGLDFAAPNHGTYFVELSVSNGQGRDYGPYAVHSLVCDPNGGTLGTLVVDIGGATTAEGARWSLVEDGKNAPQYTSGTGVLLPPKAYVVTFAAVKDWTAPADQTAVVPDGGVATIAAKYSDTHDDPVNDAKNGDGSTAGKKVTALKPSSKVQKTPRSLWTDDAADWYKFTTVANGRYTFKLEPSVKLGDAVISVYRENSTDLVAEGTDVTFLCKEAKKTYWVAVRHGSAPAMDSQYVLDYSVMQVGSLGFAKTAYSVKDSAGSVTLAVSRKDGKEGLVRCRYTTLAGSAEPGRHYVAQTGILEWKSGDAKDKKIVVTILPDLVAAWEESRTFDVEIAPVDAFDPEDGEYVPAFGATKSTVTITDATKKTPGTVSFGAWGDDDAAFANAKKPVADVRAGGTLRLRLDRTGGKDGDVAVTVTPTKGTALPDENYDGEAKTVAWADGDDDPKYVSLVTYDVGDDYQASKKLTLKLAADKTYADKPKVGAAVTVVIGDPNATQSLETYAAAAKDAGVTVKAGKAETWFFDAAGDLRNAVPAKGGKAELTLTVTGPGKFTCKPVFDDGGNAKNTATIAFGKKSVAITGEEIVEYLQKGKQTVKVTVTRDKKDTTTGPVLSFADLGEAEPLKWQPLPAATLVSPLSSEVMVADCNEKVKLMWADAGEDVRYFLYIDTNKKNLSAGKAEFEFQFDDIEGHEQAMSVYCDDCGSGDLQPGKTYYWRVDTAFVNNKREVLLLNSSSPVWTLTALPCGSARAVLKGGTDAFGVDVTAIEPIGSEYPITLVQGVAADIELGGLDVASDMTASYALAKGSKLPTGLSLKDGRIVGVPTKAGTYSAVVQLSCKKGKTSVAGGTVALAITVEKAALAAGTFNGLVFRSSDEVEGADAAELGSLTATITEAGKISASVSVAGTAYKFSGTGWSGVVPALENGQPGVTVTLTSTTKATVNKRTVQLVNVLKLTAGRGASGDGEALDTPLTAELELNLSATETGHYDGRAYRDNKKVASALEGIKAFVGYYTVSLVPTNAPAGVSGCGYVTVTVDAKGAVKASGVLADGKTKVSSSATGYLAEGANGRPALIVPLYYGKGKIAFGGWLVLQENDEGTIVARADSGLVWINADVNATYEGKSGFRVGIEPTGGYYNKLYNLQAYYYGWDLGSGSVEFDGLESAIFGSKTVLCYPGLYDDYLTLAGNTIKANKQTKAYRADNKKMLDWEKTVNPANVSFTFKQATGLYSGAFEMYGGNAEAGKETSQTKIGSFKHQGVLVMNRDAAASLTFEDAAMPGFWLAPIKISSKRTWTATLPFAIEPTASEPPPDEGL